MNIPINRCVSHCPHSFLSERVLVGERHQRCAHRRSSVVMCETEIWNMKTKYVCGGKNVAVILVWMQHFLVWYRISWKSSKKNRNNETQKNEYEILKNVITFFNSTLVRFAFTHSVSAAPTTHPTPGHAFNLRRARASFYIAFSISYRKYKYIKWSCGSCSLRKCSQSGEKRFCAPENGRALFFVGIIEFGAFQHYNMLCNYLSIDGERERGEERGRHGNSIGAKKDRARKRNHQWNVVSINLIFRIGCAANKSQVKRHNANKNKI